MPPRDNTVQPYEGFPSYGAIHGVVPNEQLTNFFHDFRRVCNRVFLHSIAGVDVEPVEFSSEGFGKFPENHPSTKEVEPNYDPRKFYRVFDLDTLGVSVLEMDPSADSAKKVRSVWERQDLGAVEKEAKNEAGRRLPRAPLRLLFNHVAGVGGRLPGVDSGDIRKKLALAPDPTKHPETLEVMSEELQIVGEAIKRRLKQFVIPFDLVPHMTFAAFKNQAKVDDIDTIIRSTDNLLRVRHVGARLDELSFRYQLVRKAKR